MPVVNNVKVACEPCIRGHRATSCNHGGDRRLVPVRKPGRPLREYHTRPSPLAIPRGKHGCRCGGATAVGPDEEAREGRRPKTATTPESDLQLLSPCSLRHHSHGSAAASPAAAEPQPVVGHALVPPPSPATGTSGHLFGARSGPSQSNGETATRLVPVSTAACFSPHPFNVNENLVTHPSNPGPEAPSSWTPPDLHVTPEYVLSSAPTPPATQPIGVNLPLCTHCAGRTPGIVQPQMVALDHLGRPQACSTKTSHLHQTSDNTSHQALVVYVVVQPQQISAEQEHQGWAVARSVHDYTDKTTTVQSARTRTSNGYQNSSGATVGWLGQPCTESPQAIVGASTNTTGAGAHSPSAWLPALPLSPIQMPFPYVNELNTSLMSPGLEHTAWSNDVSNLHRHPGDALISPLSACRCSGQHSCGCDLACMADL